MQTIVTALLSIVSFICAMRYWQYDFEAIRLYAADIACLIFDVFALVFFARSKRTKLPKGLAQGFVYFNIVIFLLGFSSFVLIDWSLETAFQQYFKNILALAAQTTFVCFVALTSVRLPPITTKKILRLYCVAVVLSSIWCILEVYFATKGIDLNKITFGAISTFRDIDEVSFQYEWADFYRATGFAGVNAQGTYIVSAVPLLLYWRPFRPKFLNVIGLAICIVALLLGMSKNAFLALFFALSFPLVFRPALAGYLLRYTALPLGVVLIFAMSYWYEFQTLAGTRFNGAEDFGVDRLLSGRSEIAQATIDAALEHPVGYGAGQYLVHIMNSDTIDLSSVVRSLGMQTSDARLAYTNVHSNWINWLFEYGVLGLIFYISFYFWLLKTLVKPRTNIALACAAGIFAMCVAAMFNSTLDQLSVQVYVALTTMACCADQLERSNVKVIQEQQSASAQLIAEPVFTV